MIKIAQFVSLKNSDLLKVKHQIHWDTFLQVNGPTLQSNSQEYFHLLFHRNLWGPWTKMLKFS